ncbi:MAG: TIGR00730 family Rossman fold protein [Chloroflexi bacterium]|nr:TIGR00730 family Rossman fold protein [Chloroflexota bacterium]
MRRTRPSKCEADDRHPAPPAGGPGRDGRTEDEKLLECPEAERRLAAWLARSDPWRLFRIMGDFVEGFDALAEIGPAVSIFGSARVGPDDPMYRAAVEVARELALAGFAIVTGGGPGIMEAANRGASAVGRVSIGCNIELPHEQKPNPYATRQLHFRYFFVRKMMFVRYAEAFVIFPGGLGTLDELFEALTLIQTDKLHNFPVILFGRAYWEGMLDWLKATVLAEEKIDPEDLKRLVVTDSPTEVRRLVVDCFKARCWRVEKQSAGRGLPGRVRPVREKADAQ